MKKTFTKIGGGLIAAYALLMIKLSDAHSQSSGDAIISRPVGQGILPGGGNEGSDIQSSILFAQIIPFLIDWTINLAVGLAVIFIIIGGYQYMTAYGDEEKRQTGTKTLFYAVIGLIVALTAYGIVFVLTRIQLS